VIRRHLLVLLSVVLVACGGGGESNGDNGGSSAPVSFAPSSATANFAAGTSATVTVQTKVVTPSAFSGGTIFVYVVDTNHVLSGALNLVQLDSMTFSATIYTSSTLPPGHYTGTFQIQLCRDANCTSQYAGSPVALPYDFMVTASTAPLSASALTSTQASMYLGGSGPSDVTVSVKGAGLNWTASTTSGWLKLTNGHGTGSGSFAVSYVPSGLGTGAYTDRVTVTSSDGQLAYVDFALQVLPVQFVVTSGNPTFSAINGATIAPQNLDFKLANNATVPWTATSSASWMIATPLSGTTPSFISLQPDPTIGPLASGSYTADLVLSSTGIPNKTITSKLSLIAPTLSAPATTVNLGGPKGRDLTAQSLAISLNTGAQPWPWSLSSLPSWLSSSTLTGFVDQNSTTLNFAPNLTSATPGSVSGLVTATAHVNGDTISLPITVNLNLDEHKLLMSEWGVGLASSPTGSVLTRTLTVRDNFGAATAWSASSDAAWLSVTSNGSTNQSPQLVLTADPTSLPTGTVSYANVTISSSTSGVSPAVVRVALWNDTATAAAMTKLSTNYLHIVADKIRPYIYVNAEATAIDVYNAYTAAKIATIPNVGAVLGEMAVSADGSILYAVDTASHSLSVVNLQSLAVVASWPLTNTYFSLGGYTTLFTVRTNGVDVVVLGDQTAYSNGRQLGNSGIGGSWLYSPSQSLAASRDGRSIYAQDAGLSPASAFAYDLDYSAISGGVLMVGARANGFMMSAANGKDIAVSADGTRIYTASGAPYSCSILNAANLSSIGSLPGGSSYPNNVEVTSDGRVICGIFGWYSTYDFWVHSSAGALLQGYKIAGYAKALRDKMMVTTPDGLIVAAQTDDPLLAFVVIGP
jgi:hypothetical protein